MLLSSTLNGDIYFSAGLQFLYFSMRLKLKVIIIFFVSSSQISFTFIKEDYSLCLDVNKILYNMIQILKNMVKTINIPVLIKHNLFFNYLLVYVPIIQFSSLSLGSSAAIVYSLKPTFMTCVYSLV